MCVCVFLFYIKSLGGVYNTQTKLNPGAALEEPEHQGIRSIKASASTQSAGVRLVARGYEVCGGPGCKFIY